MDIVEVRIRLPKNYLAYLDRVARELSEATGRSHTRETVILIALRNYIYAWFVKGRKIIKADYPRDEDTLLILSMLGGVDEVWDLVEKLAKKK